jgi:hypothetical protein
VGEKPQEPEHDKRDALIDFIRSVDPGKRFRPEEMIVAMPTVVEEGTFEIPFSPSDEAGAWKAAFDWVGGDTAAFQMEMVPGQSLFQDVAYDGWVSWMGEGTLVAWADPESSTHGWAYFAESPIRPDPAKDVDDESRTDPYRWQALAGLCWLGCADPPSDAGQW